MGQFTLTPEKKRRIAESKLKAGEAKEEYDPKAKEAPNRAVPVKPLGTLSKPNIADDTIRERVASIPRSIATDVFGVNATRANRLGEDAAAFADFIPLVGEGVGAQETLESARAGDWRSTALNAAGTLAGVAPVGGDLLGKGIKSLAKKGGREALAEAKAGIRAYHGSPHSFEPEPGYPLGRFRDDKIGTGEGAQAYGKGHYLAEGEGVAESYRDALKKHTDDFYHGDQKLTGDEELAASVLMGSPDQQAAIDWLKAAGQDRFVPLVQKMDKNLLRKEKPPPGSMYEVKINADPEHFIDWDKPLAGQPQVHDKFSNQYGPDITGERLYRSLSKDPDAAKIFQEQGIPGIKYLDAGSRNPIASSVLLDGQKIPSNDYVAQAAADALGTHGTPDAAIKALGAHPGYKNTNKDAAELLRSGRITQPPQSRNYVVFDPKIIEIVKKYGIAGALGAGLISEEMARQMQSQTGGRNAL